MNNLDFTPPPPQQSMNSPRWMMSFADLLSVILAFFVLMFSMSQPSNKTHPQNNDLAKNQEAAFSVKHSETPTNIELAKSDESLSTNYLSEVFKDKISPYPELSKIKVTTAESKLTLAINNSDFNEEIANKFAIILKGITNRIEIYSSDLDQSHAVADALTRNGVGREISFFESSTSQGQIDIVIYP